MGYNDTGGGGIAIVQIGGKWQIHFPGTGGLPSGTVSVSPGNWVHMDLWRTNGVINLYVDNVLTATTTSNPANIREMFTVGGNGRATPGSIDGRFDGLIDNVVITDLSAGAAASIAESPPCRLG